MNEFKQISYLENCLRNGKFLRWPDGTMPLTIFISPFRWYKAQNEEYEYYSMIEKALTVWERASAGKVKFESVGNLFDSQINLEWKRVERKSLGHCEFAFDKEGRLYSSEVQIGLSDGLIHQNYEDKNEVFHTIIHEMGHALGLLHSPFKDDIMHVPHQYGVTNISKKDQMTLKWLYKFPYGITKKEILAHYNLPKDFSLDKLIYMLETDTSMEELQETTQPSPLANNDLYLKKEQEMLANMNKFNISIQNFSVPADTQEYFKKMRAKKNFEGK